MWSSESQRIGKKHCTPAGCTLHAIADLVGFIGLLSLIAIPFLRGWNWRSLLIPLGVGLVSEVLFQLSWWLAARRGFRYDAERSESSWIEAGEKRTYKWPGS
jgi:hypothetical protein